MKKILFDLLKAQPLSGSKFHGGGEYIKVVFKYLVENYSDKCEIFTFYDQNLFLDEWIHLLIKKYSIKTFQVKTADEIKKIFEKEKIDIFYSGLPWYKKEWVAQHVITKGTVHGLRAIEKPFDVYEGKYSYRNKINYHIKSLFHKLYLQKKIKAYGTLINSLDEIICDSLYTKYSIIQYFPINKDIEIGVLYPPLKFTNTPKQIEQKVKEQLPNQYILLLGGDRWLKNSYRVIKAVENLFDNGYILDYKVIIVGELSNIIKCEIKHRDRFIFMDYVETAELESLYNYCDMFVYPTLNEGFGYPPLEAMKYGKTCIISAITCLPEIYGDSVYYINPYDISEIGNKILMAVSKKINEEKVYNQFKMITDRQQRDLKAICEFIIK